MVKYEYDVATESFKRVDNRGNKLKINITEARRIESLLNLGHNPNYIWNKINFINDVSITTVRTFIKNLEAGNIDLEGDYPAPALLMEDMTMEARVKRLEDVVFTPKKACDCSCDSLSKNKSWKNLWGLL